jgi:cholera toxin transcriptional activator
MNPQMPEATLPTRYRFGTFEADTGTGELRRGGIRIRINAQPFQLLVLLIERPGELVTREEIAGALWPDGTFVDFDHGVNSAMNRIREALGDSAANPRFVETLARRGYRFIASVERVEQGTDVASPAAAAGEPDRLPQPAFAGVLASAEDLPTAPRPLVQALFILFQLMYLSFYVGALANLAEIQELLTPLPRAQEIYLALIASAAVLIPVRAFLLFAVLFNAPGFRGRFLRIWVFLLIADVLWALSPFLLLHHVNSGVALACAALLVWSPFVQRSLVLMGAAEFRSRG